MKAQEPTEKHSHAPKSSDKLPAFLQQAQEQAQVQMAEAGAQALQNIEQPPEDDRRHYRSRSRGGEKRHESRRDEGDRYGSGRGHEDDRGRGDRDRRRSRSDRGRGRERDERGREPMSRRRKDDAAGNPYLMDDNKIDQEAISQAIVKASKGGQ